MKLIQYAVASIVDANTGYGLIQGGGKPNFNATERRGSEIRAGSVIAALGRRIGAGLAGVRERIEERHQLARLNALSEHQLNDIGIRRGDLTAVASGATTLVALEIHRKSRLTESASKQGTVVDIGRTGGVASNDDSYRPARCA